MKFPDYNQASDLSVETYEYIKALVQSTDPKEVWDQVPREECAQVLQAIFLIYLDDDGVITGDDASELNLDSRILSVALKESPQVADKDFYEGLFHFLSIAPEYGSEASSLFVEEKAYEYMKAWGQVAVDFAAWVMLEHPFHQADRDCYVEISSMLFHYSDEPEFAQQVEKIYLAVLEKWQWNDVFVNADAMEALSLMKSLKALPLIEACLREKLFEESIIRVNHIKKNYGDLFVIPKVNDQVDSGAPPNYAGDENYGRLLRAMVYLDVEEARLMTLAEIFSPFGGKPSDLIYNILSRECLDEEDGPYEFRNSAEARRFYGQTMAFWNECLQYKEKLPPLGKLSDLATLGLFFRVDSFFGPLLEDLSADPSAFNKQQKDFLRSYKALRKNVDAWWNSRKDGESYKNLEFENQLQKLWDEAPRFI